jgi:hypothetical protein
LKAYVLSLAKCPVTLKEYFENPLLVTVFNLFNSKLRIFYCAIQNIEKQCTTVFTVKSKITKLLLNLEHRKPKVFFISCKRSGKRFTERRTNKNGVFCPSHLFNLWTGSA